MAEKTMSESGQTAGKSTTQSMDTDTTSTGDIEVNRSPEEYAKRVMELSAENKKRKERERTYQQQLEELSHKLKSYEESQASEQGKYKELADKYRKELEVKENQLKTERKNFAYEIVTNQFARAAEASGCTNTDHLIKFAGTLGLLDELEPDESFRLTGENLKSVVEKAQRELPYLFGKSAPLVKDGAPKTLSTKVSLADVPLEQRMQMLAEMSIRGQARKQKTQ